MTAVKQRITDLLLARHEIADSANADFRIQSQDDLASTMSTVTATLTMLLGSIAGISLLVGGIGIMNMMLTTVTERIREIGLRKAIGATPGDLTLAVPRRGGRAHGASAASSASCSGWGISVAVPRSRRTTRRSA